MRVEVGTDANTPHFTFKLMPLHKLCVELKLSVMQPDFSKKSWAEDKQENIQWDGSFGRVLSKDEDPNFFSSDPDPAQLKKNRIRIRP